MAASSSARSRNSSLKANSTPDRFDRDACRQSFAYAAFFSLFINLLLLLPAIYMLQVYDRVLSSGSVSTLLMLTLVAAFLFIVMGGLEWVRSVANQRLRVAELLSRLQQPDDSLHLARQSFEAFRELASESAPPALIRDAIVSASRLANDLTNRKDFVSAQPVWQQATEWSDRLLAEVATEFSDRQTMTLVQRNLLLVEMKLGWANKASERLNRLRQMLSSLATDATTHDRPEQREWVTTQLQELTMLNINP